MDESRPHPLLSSSGRNTAVPAAISIARTTRQALPGSALHSYLLPQQICRSFAEVRRELQIKILATVHEKDRSGNAYGMDRAPRQLFRKNELLVEELFLAAELASHTNDQALETQDQRALAGCVRSLRAAVIGDGQESSRSRILAILLLMNVCPAAEAWIRFINQLSLDDGEGAVTHFCDSHLPFTENEIWLVLGGNICRMFYMAQNFYCPAVTETFAGLRGQLRAKMQRAEVRQGQSDSFLPSIRVKQIIASNATLVQELYMQTTRERFLLFLNDEDPGDFFYKTVQDSQIFSFHAVARARILAILLYSGVDATCQPWKIFVESCLCRESRYANFCDDQLPMEMSTVREYTGEEYANTFFLQQWAFSPLVINKDTTPQSSLIRMPFVEKTYIGSGPYGNVFRVLLAPGSLYSRDGTVDSSRAVTCHTVPPNSGSQIKLLKGRRSAQHESIATPIAWTIHYDESLSVFYDQYECNLWQYMTDVRPHGPGDLYEKVDMLKGLVGIADGLLFLHGLSKEDQQSNNRLVCLDQNIGPQNILVVKDNDSRIIFKISDFAISRTQKRSQSVSQEHSLPSEALDVASDSQIVSSLTGHLSDNAHIQEKADVWSLVL